MSHASDLEGRLATAKAHIKHVEALNQALVQERDAARRQVDGYVQWINNCATLFEQRSPEQVRAELTRVAQERDQLRAAQAIDIKNNNEYRELLAQAQAELTRLRGLVEALPKIEGKVNITKTPSGSSRGEITDFAWCLDVDLEDGESLDVGTFDTEAEAEAYTALLEYRATLAPDEAGEGKA